MTRFYHTIANNPTPDPQEGLRVSPHFLTSASLFSVEVKLPSLVDALLQKCSGYLHLRNKCRSHYFSKRLWIAIQGNLHWQAITELHVLMIQYISPPLHSSASTTSCLPTSDNIGIGSSQHKQKNIDTKNEQLSDTDRQKSTVSEI